MPFGSLYHGKIPTIVLLSHDNRSVHSRVQTLIIQAAFAFFRFRPFSKGH